MTNLPPSAASLRGAVDLSSLVNPAPPVAPPTGGASSLVVEATDATFSSILELSNSVPVLVEFYGQGLAPSLAGLVAEFGGRMVLATIDGTKNPQLVQAFQVAEVPTVAAVIGGRPLQLFVGLPEEEEIRAVLNQVLEVAKQQNITGTVPVADDEAAPAEPVEEPLPPAPPGGVRRDLRRRLRHGDRRVPARHHAEPARRPRRRRPRAGVAARPPRGDDRRRDPLRGRGRAHRRARTDRKSTRLNSSHGLLSRMPSSA